MGISREQEFWRSCCRMLKLFLHVAQQQDSRRKGGEMTRERWRIICVYSRIHYVHFYFGIICHQFHLAITRFLFLFLFFFVCVCLCLLNIVVQTLLCHLVSCGTSESLMSPVKQAPQKSPSDTEGLVNSVPARSHQVNCLLLLSEAGSSRSVGEMVWKN